MKRTAPPTHKWQFKSRFRSHAFGWRGSRTAVQRVKEAVTEIRSVARSDAVLAAEGAIAFLERVSPALEHVDSSSGAIGTAVNNAIDALVPIIVAAPVDEARREAWLERLFDAYQNDGIPYIEELGDYWGELCRSKALAGRWADELIDLTRHVWRGPPGGFFKGTTCCLSALLAAERYDELLELLELAPHRMWHYRKFGVRALAASGRAVEAIRYAEATRGLNESPTAIARACEQILLDSDLADEAYARYGLAANRAQTHLAWFRAVAKRYPHKAPADILEDLVAYTPGDEGKWFAAAKSAKLYDEAIALAFRSPCSPQTLTRAARDFAAKRPDFAIEAGIAALHWLALGYGYEVTSMDVRAAYAHAMTAAENAGRVDETRRRIREVIGGGAAAEFVTRWLAGGLD